MAAHTEFSVSTAAVFPCRWNRTVSEGCSDPVLGSNYSWVSKFYYLGDSLSSAANLPNDSMSAGFHFLIYTMGIILLTSHGLGELTEICVSPGCHARNQRNWCLSVPLPSLLLRLTIDAHTALSWNSSGPCFQPNWFPRGWIYPTLLSPGTENRVQPILVELGTSGVINLKNN